MNDTKQSTEDLASLEDFFRSDQSSDAKRFSEFLAVPDQRLSVRTNG